MVAALDEGSRAALLSGLLAAQAERSPAWALRLVQLESGEPQLWRSAPQLAADVAAAVLASSGSEHLAELQGMLQAAAGLLGDQLHGGGAGAEAEAEAAGQQEVLARAQGLVAACQLLTMNGLPTGVCEPPRAGPAL
jgi:hypothetical protein